VKARLSSHKSTILVSLRCLSILYSIAGFLWRYYLLKARLTRLYRSRDYALLGMLAKAVLKVNRQIRQEALPLAYRKTAFWLDDMDDVIKLLIAVGQIGRDNIRSLQFPWTSRSEIAYRWEESPHADDNDIRLPALHVLKCVQLLRLCKRLESLRICFNRDVLENNSENQFTTDPGIAGLSTLGGVRTLEIVDHACESLEQHRLVRRMRQEIQRVMDGSEVF
jgi:hypothetical protein